jgi:serine/threonine protein kinase
MGNTESSGKGVSKFLESYQKREEVNDDRFGKVTIYNQSHNPSNQIMVKSRWSNTAPDATELESFSSARSTNNHKCLSKLLYHGFEEEDQAFSSFYRHNLAFEYWPKNLEQEIHDKEKNPAHEFFQKYYSEPEVWYLIEKISSLLYSFWERDYHHGDIQPKNIFIDSHGMIKVCDNSLINYGETGYHKMLYGGQYHAALSPELIKAFENKAVHPNHDPIKSDIYSLGITVLCAALNKPIEAFYNFSVPSINHDNIKAGLQKMADLHFSPQVISTVKQMLDDNEEKRTSIESLKAFMDNHQSQIDKGHNSVFRPNHSDVVDLSHSKAPVGQPQRIANVNATPNFTSTPLNSGVRVNSGNQVLTSNVIYF